MTQSSWVWLAGNATHAGSWEAPTQLWVQFEEKENIEDLEAAGTVKWNWSQQNEMQVHF